MAVSFDWKHVKEIGSESFTYDKGVWKLDNKKCTAVLFYAPWCSFCKGVKGEWDRFGGMMAKSGMDVVAVNCDENNELLETIRDDMPQMIVSFPTMLIFKVGKPERRIGRDDKTRKAEVFKKECVGLCLKK